MRTNHTRLADDHPTVTAMTGLARSHAARTQAEPGWLDEGRFFVHRVEDWVRVAQSGQHLDAGEYVEVPVRPVAILNTTIVAPDAWPDEGAEGAVPVEVAAIRVSNERARVFVAELGYVSHVGHEPTAQLASTLLGVPVQADRAPYRMRTGDIALCLKLRDRAPEGTILSIEEIEEIGYDWVAMTRHA